MIDLETDRLKFRLWQEADFDAFAEYFADEKNTQYLGGKMTKEQAWRLMSAYIGHYHLKGFSYLALEEKSSKQLVGTVGLWKSPAWPELELGYWLLNNMQGKGYGTEAGQKVKDFAFNTLKAETLVSYIAPSNQASINLAKRIGAKYDNEIELLTFGVHAVYRYLKI